VKYWKYAFLYNLPLIPYFFSSYILSSSDRLMIAQFCGEDKAGIYGIAYTMSAVVNIVWSSINATLVPTIYQRCDEGRRNTLTNIVVPVLAGYGAMCVAIMLLAPEIIAFLAPASYGEGMYVIPVIVGGIFFMAFFSIFSHIIFYEKKSKYVAGASVLAAIVNFLLNLIFIPLVGYFAAGYTTLAAYLVQVIWAYIAMRKAVHDSVYDMKKLTAIALAVLVFAVFSPLIYDMIWIRIGILAVMGLTAWKYRDFILRGIFGDKYKK
jgi:O-antigen/teichoic acid export membrane protein